MKKNLQLTRMSLLFVTVFIISGLVILRLFYLQILAHGYYSEVARTEQFGTTVLPARRGEIFIEDYHSGESYRLATNTTLSMVYADPTLIDDPDLVAETLAPLLFDLEEEKERDEARYERENENAWDIENDELRQEALEKLELKDDESLYDDYLEDLKNTLATRTRDTILITQDLEQETIDKIKSERLKGVDVTENGSLYAYPKEIDNQALVANRLADILGGDQDRLASILEGKNRYVVLKNKLEPEISNQIEKILEEDRSFDEDKPSQEPPYDFIGIRMQEEYFRLYPEGELAAQVLGFVAGGNGQYGIEGSFNEALSGKDGVFTSKIDAHNKQITVGETIIEQSVDGADITLTLDRAIQLQVERELAFGVDYYDADSGQVLVMNPKTGAILAMAHYPTYNPNEFGEVYEKERINLEPDEEPYITGTEENPKHWLYIQKDPDVRIEIFPDEEKEGRYLAFENKVGPEVYKNKMVQESYEPGSIFKPIAMAAGIDAGEVTANTTFVDDACLPVDYNVHTGEYDFCIENVGSEHYGIQTMTQVLEKSNNVGMGFVAQRLGASLYYSYLKDFGLLERTGIKLIDEVIGKVEHFDAWTESELVTKAYGQGIAMSVLQIAQSYTALANNGLMVRPRLISKIQYPVGSPGFPEGGTEIYDTEPVRQVLKPETAQTVTAMMTATAESYSQLKLDSHYYAGKSGTAQTFKWGKALTGPGTTIAGFVGYGPIDTPEFLVVVKLDRPRTKQWGAETAGPITESILDFLYDYYTIPPDKVD